ncbi:hypothetical protein BH09MYX1_BH09MYX1_62240 [soil metagenome]
MFGILGIALIGGLILNVMPCVLPVLALKAFSVVEHAKDDPKKRRMHGIAYTMGTMSLFIGLAILVLVLKTTGKHLGWGMQFQQPKFVAFMCALVFAFGLNSLGVFEITLSSSGETGDDEKFSGSYANGLFAAIMSTPCSAPFLGTAVAFALGSAAAGWQTILVFATIGFGLALPYLMLTQIPAFSRLLPRPGRWMETVKQVMGFTLMGTAIWLYRTLQVQVTPQSSNSFLIFLLILAVALWAGGRFGGVAAPPVRRWSVRALQLGLVAGAAVFILSFAKPEPVAVASMGPDIGAPGHTDPPVIVDGHIAWTAYDTARIKAEHARGRPVFLDFTAEWCATCKVNEKSFIETDTVRGAFERTKILPMKVDFTNTNDELDALLDSTGRSGIPDYMIVYPDGTRDLLPEVITAEMVQKHLDEAEKKYPASKYASN